MDRMTGTFFKGKLVDGNAVVVPMAGAPLPCLVWVRPVAGDTVAMTYSTDNGVTYNAGLSVTVYTEDTFLAGVTHVKFQRTAGTGTTSEVGLC